MLLAASDHVLLPDSIYGPTLEVEKLPAGEHYEIEPLSELAEMVHPDKIIPVMVKP